MSKTIKLQYPYETADGKKLTELTLRRATVKDLKKVGKSDNAAESEVVFFASLLGLIPEDLDAMDAADYKAIQDFYLEQMKEYSKSR